MLGGGSWEGRSTPLKNQGAEQTLWSQGGRWDGTGHPLGGWQALARLKLPQPPKMRQQGVGSPMSLQAPWQGAWPCSRRGGSRTAVLPIQPPGCTPVALPLLEMPEITVLSGWMQRSIMCKGNLRGEKGVFHLPPPKHVFNRPLGDLWGNQMRCLPHQGLPQKEKDFEMCSASRWTGSWHS